MCNLAAMKTPADWYEDPLHWHQLRYWNGTKWTDHVANDGVGSTDPVSRGPKPGENTTPPKASAQAGQSLSMESRRHLVSAAPRQLAELGERAFGGESPYPPGFTLVHYDEFALAAYETAEYPSSGTPKFADFISGFLTEVTSVGRHSAPWGLVGALGLAINVVTSDEYSFPAFTQLTIEALDVLRRSGVAWTVVPPLASRIWTNQLGWDGAQPKGWPSALSTVGIPDGDGPQIADLVPDEPRVLARDAGGRTTSAVLHPDGRVIAVIDGPDDSDGQIKQWELGLEADSYRSFLIELGERLVTPPPWTHEELLPYIPCLIRTREEMAAAALAADIQI